MSIRRKWFELGHFFKKLIFINIVGLLALPLLISIFLSQPVRADISSGLTAYYSFDDISGSTAPDSSGNGYDGTITGGAVTVSGAVGDALSFDGADDTVDIPHQLLASQTPDFSYSFYFKADVGGDDSQYLLAQSSSGTNNNDCFSVAYDNVAGSLKVLTTNAAQNARITSDIDATGWTHIAVTHSYSTNESKLYINGVAQTGYAMSCSQALASQFLLGRSPWAGYNQQLQGSLDEVRIYSRILSDADIYDLATAGDTNSVSITTPTEGTVVRGSTTLESSVSGSPAISSIQYYANGEAIGAPIADAPYSYNWDTTAIDQGDYSITAVGTDSNGDAVPSLALNVVVDNDPVINMNNTKSIQQTTAEIVWVTDEQTNGQIEYGLTSSYGSQSDLVSDLSYYHNHQLTNLLPNTTYHYQIISQDNFGNEVTSGDLTFSTITDVAGNQWHVTTDGTSEGDGSIENPWDLATALAQPLSVQPGDTIWVHAGTYAGVFTSTLTGTASSPIVLRNYNNERVIIDGESSNSSVITVYGAYTWYWGLEVINSDTTRTIEQAGSNPITLPRGLGYYVLGPGTRFINNVVHDTAEGFGFWTPATNSELYGNIVYYNGWEGPDRGHGHGLYVQNNTGLKNLTNNIVFKNFGYGLHAYTEGGTLHNILTDSNVFFSNGALSNTGYTQNMLHGGYTVANNPMIFNNRVYSPIALGGGLGIGYAAGCNTPTIEGNYIVSHSAFDLSSDCSHNMVSGNTFYGSYPGSAPTNYPDNEYFNVTVPTVNNVYVAQNYYEPTKTYVTIYNWQGLSNVSVDASTVLNENDTYAIYDTQDYFGDPIATGTFSGTTLAVPMTTTGLTDTVGEVPVAPTHTSEEFGSFVLVKTGHVDLPPDDDDDPPDDTPPDDTPPIDDVDSDNDDGASEGSSSSDSSTADEVSKSNPGSLARIIFSSTDSGNKKPAIKEDITDQNQSSAVNDDENQYVSTTAHTKDKGYTTFQKFLGFCFVVITVGSIFWRIFVYKKH